MEQKQYKTTKAKNQMIFNQIFNNYDNTSCFSCGRQCRQWVETRHAIFLCLSCATQFKQIPKVVNIKSASLDLWSQEQFKILKIGGNAKFKQYLKKYGLENANPQIVLSSNVAQFYRLYLLNSQRLSLADAPEYKQQRNLSIQNNALNQASGNQILEEAKQKIFKAGESTMYYGGKAYQKIQNKISNIEYKENLQLASNKINDTAKLIWNFVADKMIGQHNNNETEIIYSR